MKPIFPFLLLSMSFSLYAAEKPSFQPKYLEPEMVLISAGSFRMGNIQDGANGGEPDELPVHKVTLTKNFEIGVYEVTFAEYDLFCEATKREKPRDNGWGRDKHPVINISWHDAVSYAEWLSSQTGKKYRLPSEAEWEYAARGGTESRFWWGNEPQKDMANCGDCSSEFSENQQPQVVGKFPKNPFGLHDIIGNVWEWVEDWYGSYSPTAQTDPHGATYGVHKVIRGNAWSDTIWRSRSSFRGYHEPKRKTSYLGFRLVRQP